MAKLGLGPGRLSQQITIQTQTVAVDSFSEGKATFANWKTVFAAVETLSGRALEQAKSLVAEVNMRIIVNYDDVPGIDDTMRVIYGSRKLDIRYVPIVGDNERPIYLEIYCQEITNAPVTQ